MKNIKEYENEFKNHFLRKINGQTSPLYHEVVKLIKQRDFMFFEQDTRIVQNEWYFQTYDIGYIFSFHFENGSIVDLRQEKVDNEEFTFEPLSEIELFELGIIVNKYFQESPEFEEWQEELKIKEFDSLEYKEQKKLMSDGNPENEVEF